MRPLLKCRTIVSYLAAGLSEQGVGLARDGQHLALRTPGLADHAQALDQAEQRAGDGVWVPSSPDRSIGLAEPDEVAQRGLDPAQRGADLDRDLRVQAGEFGGAGDDQATAPAFAVAGGLRE